MEIDINRDEFMSVMRAGFKSKGFKNKGYKIENTVEDDKIKVEQEVKKSSDLISDIVEIDDIDVENTSISLASDIKQSNGVIEEIVHSSKGNDISIENSYNGYLDDELDDTEDFDDYSDVEYSDVDEDNELGYNEDEYLDDYADSEDEEYSDVTDDYSDEDDYNNLEDEEYADDYDEDDFVVIENEGNTDVSSINNQVKSIPLNEGKIDSVIKPLKGKETIVTDDYDEDDEYMDDEDYSDDGGSVYVEDDEYIDDEDYSDENDDYTDDIDEDYSDDGGSEYEDDDYVDDTYSDNIEDNVINTFTEVKKQDENIISSDNKLYSSVSNSTASNNSQDVNSDIVYERGMTIREFLRLNKSHRDRETVLQYFSNVELSDAEEKGIIFRKRNKYII